MTFSARSLMFDHVAIARIGRKDTITVGAMLRHPPLLDTFTVEHRMPKRMTNHSRFSWECVPSGGRGP